MIKKTFILIFLSVVLMGCNNLMKQEEEKKQIEVPKKEFAFKVGDIVVANWGKIHYREGKIEKIEEFVTINPIQGNSAFKSSKEQVYELPKEGNRPDVKEGDVILAQKGREGSWIGAKIFEIKEDNYKAWEADTDTILELKPNQIIKASEETVKDLLEKADKHWDLLEADSKKVVLSKEKELKPEDKIVAVKSVTAFRVKFWASGKLQKINNKEGIIEWDDDSAPTTLSVDKIFPYPNDSNTEMPKENQFLLVKPREGYGSKWYYAKTISVNNNSVEIKEAENGVKRTIKPGDFLLLD